MKTYNDIFVEEIVRRDRGARETVIKALAVFLVLILTFIAFLLVDIFFPAVFAVLCILLFFAFKYTVKEYEYSFINGDVDIDCILGKRKRKRVLQTSCKNIKLMARLEPGSTKPEGVFNSELDASASAGKSDKWYFICETGDDKRLLVYFSPTERMLNAFKVYLGVKMDWQATDKPGKTDKAITQKEPE